jgi:hypothetical protein
LTPCKRKANADKRITSLASRPAALPAQQPSRAKRQTQRIRHPRLGTHKLHHLIGQELHGKGIKLGRDALFDQLRGAGLLIYKKLRRWFRNRSICTTVKGRSQP